MITMLRGFNFCFVNINSILKLDIHNEFRLYNQLLHCTSTFKAVYAIFYMSLLHFNHYIFLMYARHPIQSSLLEVIVSSNGYNKLCTHTPTFVSFAHIHILHISFTFITLVIIM